MASRRKSRKKPRYWCARDQADIPLVKVFKVCLPKGCWRLKRKLRGTPLKVIR